MKILPRFNPVSSCTLCFCSFSGDAEKHNTNFFRSSNSFDEALKHTETWNKCGYNKQIQLCCLTYSTCTNPTLKIFIFRIGFSRFVFLFEKIFTFFCFISVKGAKQWKEQVANGSHSPQPSHFLCVVNVESLVSGAPLSSVASLNVVECKPFKETIWYADSHTEQWKKSNDSLYFLLLQLEYQSVTGPH